ncbi:hypothetical protein BV898_09744 [Hypsibius exemplaris]|uniref:Uncharacterized protein n=1 Tax=Hypsibius exemplaris TaxID=2072580 RepID=A0A1W0WLM7_HYPEX|nr:hypothetical protein BV898_09744 [Hypsibius exemplaris]
MIIRHRNFFEGLLVSLMSLAVVGSTTKNELFFLKRLLLYRGSGMSVTLPPMLDTSTVMMTLTTPVTTTELSLVMAQANGTQLMDDLYNTIFTGNGTFEKGMRLVIKDNLPHIKMLSRINSTDRLSRQRALVQLAVKMQPLIRPLAASNPNLTAQVYALGDLFNPNRTARGYGGGGGGWGGSCCCCGWGGGGGGGNNNDLAAYLLAKQNYGNDDLSQILPYLFGLLALLIMKLPT